MTDFKALLIGIIQWSIVVLVIFIAVVGIFVLGGILVNFLHSIEGLGSIK